MPNTELPPKKEMTAEDVVGLVDLLEANGIELYVDGGWGVDALLGEQTRVHNDLDIAMPHEHDQKLRELLAAEGYSEVERDDTRDCNYVLRDTEGREVDVHTYTFDEDGNNVFGVEYKPEHLTGKGTINGREVKCIPPTAMVEFHTGYELDEDDWHDVSKLCEKFNIDIPKDYERFENA